MTERERLIELLQVVPVDVTNPRMLEMTADFLLENGVILPPVDIGDVVYIIYKKNVCPVTVRAIKIDTKTNGNRFCVEGWIQVGRSYEHRYMATFKWESVGKTVFLTREEAEKALTSK